MKIMYLHSLNYRNLHLLVTADLTEFCLLKLAKQCLIGRIRTNPELDSI